MKISAIFLFFVVQSLFAQISPEGFLEMFDKTANAAISGHNDRHLTNVSPEEAALACVQGGFISFDYYRDTREADLSSTSSLKVGLKTDYAGNPYDHYAYLGGREPEFFADTERAITVTKRLPDGRPFYGFVDHFQRSRACNIVDQGETVVLGVYMIQLQIIYNGGFNETLNLYYCPRCDLYYCGLNLYGGLYFCTHPESRTIGYTGIGELNEFGNLLYLINEDYGNESEYTFIRER